MEEQDGFGNKAGSSLGSVGRAEEPSNAGWSCGGGGSLQEVLLLLVLPENLLSSGGEL